jgi:hypothetical protein
MSISENFQCNGFPDYPDVSSELPQTLAISWFVTVKGKCNGAQSCAVSKGAEPNRIHPALWH